MSPTADALRNALAYQQNGRLDEAERLYRQILAVDPSSATAWHYLGMIAYQTGKYDLALQHLARALALGANSADFFSNQGLVLQEMGKLAEAISAYQHALEVKPDHARAHNNLGNALREQGDLNRAASCYKRAIALQSDYAEAHYNFGLTLQNQAKQDEAIASYRRALQLKPDYPEAYNNLGLIFQDQRNLDEAIANYRRALELRAQFAEAHNNLGSVFREQGKLDEAAACFLKVLELQPAKAEVHNRLGIVLDEHGEHEEAADCYRRALDLPPNAAVVHVNLGANYLDQGKTKKEVESFTRALAIKPEFAAAYNNLGLVFHDQKRLAEAAKAFQHALELKPDDADAHFNLSLLMLQCGDFEHGWPEYEWRWKTKGHAPRRLNGPSWDGRPLTGDQSLLFYMDQGLGDALQFIRYAPVAKQRVGHVVLRCARTLMPLLSRCCGIDELVPDEVSPPAFDVQIALTSLGWALTTTLATIPSQIPYLYADPTLIERWEQALPSDGIRIGIAWQGNPKFKQDKKRSIPLVEFEPLAQLPGLRLISLQRENGVDQIAAVRDRLEVVEPGPDVDEVTGAFMDTAAIMMNLDLVITSDTAIAHLAGGLGVPVWVALSYMPDWRWLLDRSDSPWYPTMRLFRQKTPGDWASVFEAMKAELTAKLCGRSPKSQPGDAQAHFRRGLALHAENKLDDALASYRHAIELKLDHAEAHYQLGLIYHGRNMLDEATTAYRLAVQARPNFADAYNNLGVVLADRGLDDEACASYRRALEIKPDFASAHFNIANVFQRRGQTEEAIGSHRQAIAIDPLLVGAQNNLGNVLHSTGKFDEAIACYRRAIELKPDYAQAYNNLGYALQQQRQLAEASTCYERAIKIDPQYAEAHFRHAMLNLLEGDFENGFAEYEWLWKTEDFKSGAPERQARDGSPLKGRKSIVLHADQGFGDIFQFVRYAPLVKQRVRKVILRCSPATMPLLRGCPGIDEVVSMESPLPPFDAEAYLSSLPRVFGTTLETIPRSVPYLHADEELVKQWRVVLPTGKLRIGIAWQGNPKFADDKWRSIPLSQFAPLAEIPGVQLISLQKGLGAEQLTGAKERFAVLDLGPDIDSSSGAFMDTAAIMKNLDLVITSDTAMAHLAGGLGVAVWVALSYMPDWRWLLDRSDSPWYPTMRLFRQQTLGDWAGVFAEIKQAAAAQFA